MNTARDWMTVNEASERLGIGSKAVRSLLTNRLLGCRRVGMKGLIQITEAHIQAYLESCEVAVRAEGKSKPAKPPKAAKPQGEKRHGRAGTVERLDGKPPRYY